MKKWKWFLLFAVSVFIMISVVCVVFCTLLLNQQEIYPNIYIEHVNIGNMSRDDAISTIESVFKNELMGRSIRLYHNEYTWEFTYESLGYSYLYEEAIEKAHALGRQGNLATRLKSIIDLRNKPISIALKGNYNLDLIGEIILKIDDVVKREAVDASIIRENGVFVITNEVLGKRVDLELTKKRIEESIRNYRLHKIELPIKFEFPRITREKLLTIQDIIGHYTTEFDSSVVGRSNNILLASNSIDGTLLMTGEAFSFNKQTGRRTEEEGYQLAPVIVDGELVPAIGGGICQVSSTLYVAVLKADLEVLQRRNHSRPVSYMQIGQDATVSYDFIDFQFANNRNYPVYLASYIEDNKFNIKFFGKRINNIHIKINSVIVSEIELEAEIIEDSNMYLGETKIKRNGRLGFRVETYKIYVENEVKIKRELISKDFYPPLKAIVLKGTK